jgi:mono/diheme cytochrome c family protein
MRILRWALSVPAVLTLSACTHSARLDEVGAESGSQLYKVYCSNCHGAEAHGDGPVADIIKVPVPDLTRIASRNGGSFPAEKVYRTIDGQWEIPAHGTRHMPVWGYEFFGNAGDDQNRHSKSSQRIDTLVGYLRNIQQPQ